LKTRYNNHNQILKHRRKRNTTELSKAVWQARDAGRYPIIQWSIAAQTVPYKPEARSFNLCLTEKLAILQADSATILNKKFELNSKCRHKNEFKLKNFNG